MKDIFIDAEIANGFAIPKNEHIRELINWLFQYDKEDKENNAYLLVSEDLRREYFKGNHNCDKNYSIISIYITLQGQDRLIPTTKKKD